jgi:hypothetical protein
VTNAILTQLVPVSSRQYLVVEGMSLSWVPSLHLSGTNETVLTGHVLVNVRNNVCLNRKDRISIEG